MEHTVRDSFGTTAEGQIVDRYTLTNANGSMARIITLGATVTELHVRDRQGELADVVLGFDTAADYEANTPYMGCVVGRVGFSGELRGWGRVCGLDGVGATGRQRDEGGEDERRASHERSLSVR